MFTWAVDLHSFFADPDPAVFLNADPDPAALKMRFRIQLKTNFFAFFCFYLINFSSRIRIHILKADPDSGEKMNADPYGSGSTALVFTLSFFRSFYGNTVDTQSLSIRRWLHWNIIYYACDNENFVWKTQFIYCTVDHSSTLWTCGKKALAKNLEYNLFINKKILTFPAVNRSCRFYSSELPVPS